jgi:hypothetical protein
MRARPWLRAALIFFAVGDLLIGAWAYLLPHYFYNDIPTVAMNPPFSQHFVSDVGAFYISQGVVLVLAAVAMERRLVRAALAGYVTFAVLHLVFHTTHLAGMPAHDSILLTTALVLDATIPAALLIVAESGGRESRPGRGGVRTIASPEARGGSHGQTVEPGQAQSPQ